MKNRSRYEVIAAILRSCHKPESRTKIMYKAMLSNDQCKLYLDSLVQYELVQPIDTSEKLMYIITKRGNEFLKYYEQMKELLPDFIEVNEDYFEIHAEQKLIR